VYSSEVTLGKFASRFREFNALIQVESGTEGCSGSSGVLQRACMRAYVRGGTQASDGLGRSSLLRGHGHACYAGSLGVRRSEAHPANPGLEMRTDACMLMSMSRQAASGQKTRSPHINRRLSRMDRPPGKRGDSGTQGTTWYGRTRGYLGRVMVQLGHSVLSPHSMIWFRPTI
jgi:hypothetical protein